MRLCTQAAPDVPRPRKSTGVTVVLALIPGAFGIWGLGHIYAGRVRDGIVLLVSGVVLAGLFWATVGTVSIGPGPSVSFVSSSPLPFFLGLILFFGWLLETYHAYDVVRLKSVQKIERHRERMREISGLTDEQIDALSDDEFDKLYEKAESRNQV